MIVITATELRWSHREALILLRFIHFVRVVIHLYFYRFFLQPLSALRFIWCWLC